MMTQNFLHSAHSLFFFTKRTTLLLFPREEKKPRDDVISVGHGGTRGQFSGFESIKPAAPVAHRLDGNP